MSIRSTILRSGVVMLAGATLFASAGSHVAGAAPPPARPKAGAVSPAISADQIFANAETWHPHTDQRIPYSQTATHNGYRTDCSGYASMALGLSTPGLNTVGLADSSVSSPIAMGDLQPGDLVIDATGDSNTRHVVIFQNWTDGSHSAYMAYEQRGSYGTDHRTLTYGLDSGSEFHAYQPNVLGGGGTGKYYVDTYADAVGYASPDTGSAQGVLNQGTNYVYCRVWGAQVTSGSDFNHYWLKTDLDSVYSGGSGSGAYVPALYLSRWGNDEAKDNNGAEIPDC